MCVLVWPVGNLLYLKFKLRQFGRFVIARGISVEICEFTYIIYKDFAYVDTVKLSLNGMVLHKARVWCGCVYWMISSILFKICVRTRAFARVFMRMWANGVLGPVAQTMMAPRIAFRTSSNGKLWRPKFSLRRLLSAFSNRAKTCSFYIYTCSNIERKRRVLHSRNIRMKENGAPEIIQLANFANPYTRKWWENGLKIDSYAQATFKNTKSKMVR